MKLFDVRMSPNCRKVRILARELGLPLETVAVSLSDPRLGSHVAANPLGKVPTLVEDDGFSLWESGAILLYLAEREHSALVPEDARVRADMYRWLFFAATHVQPWMSVLGQERLIKPRRGGSPDPVLCAYAERELARFLPVLDQRLRESAFLVGPYTVADIAVGAGLEDSELRGVALSTGLAAWRERLRARSTWADPA